MKRTLLIILCLCFLSFGSLAGCSQSGNAPAPSASVSSVQASGAPASGNAIQQMLDSGEKVLVGFSMSTVADEMMQTQAKQMQEKFKDLGIDMQYVASENDISVQITQIENFISMGAKEIIIACNQPPSALKDICEKAMSKGIYVVFSGNADVNNIGFTPSGANAMDGTAAGEILAKMALKWVEQAYPGAAEGSIHVGAMAVDGISMSDDMLKAYDATFAGTPCKVTYKSPLAATTEHGYNAAQEGLSFDKDIRIFLGFTADDAVGATNYFEANKADYDLSKYAVFCCGVSGAGVQLIDNSKNNQSVFRGLCVIGEADNMTKDLFIVCRDLLFGTAQPPYFRLNTLSTYNTVGYEIESPPSPSST